MIPFQVIIENSTGAVLAAGNTDLTKDGKYDSENHSIRTDAPEGVKVKSRTSSSSKEWHRYNGSTYVLVSNSTPFHRERFNQRRRRLFSQTAWIRDRNKDEIDNSLTPTLNTTQYEAWLDYWQALSDLPSTPGFDPANPNWPTEPN